MYPDSLSYDQTLPFRHFTIQTNPELIRLAVMLYIRFPLSLRNVEDPLLEWGMQIRREAVCQRLQRQGPNTKHEF